MSSSQTGSSIMEQRRRPLSEWVRSFYAFCQQQQQLFGGNKNFTTALSSDDYLIPALRVASSLADQICKAEETCQLPTPSSDWMNSIVVHSLQSMNFEDGRFGRRKADEYEDSFDVGKVFTAEGTSPTTSDERSEENGEGDNSIRVEILPQLFHKTGNNSKQATAGILDSLGVVFYEIFSGGQRPAELERQQVEEITNGSQETEELSEELSGGFNPFDEGGSINLEGGCGIYDDFLGEYNLSDDESIYDDITSQVQRPRKKRTQNDNHNISCSMSVEPHKAKGLPRALCDLVANMVHCADGIISKDDAYRNVSEVRNDLQLMLDKPSIYLHDQEMASLSTTGLHFDGTVFGRNVELATIIGVYRRALSGESELVTISGSSGTGKSFLACEFGKHVVSSGGILLYGKFDQLQQGKPFSALASAFNQYCGILLQNGELDSAKQKLAHQCNDVMGQEAYHLSKLIPNLASLLGLDMNSISLDDGCVNAQRRLQYLLCRFVELTSSIFHAPVTLFLDDLQWADAASIAAVNQLFLTGGLNSQNTRFFFIGCNREVDNNSTQIWRTMCKSNLLNARVTNIKLDLMGEDTLNTMISETLCLSPRLTWSLSSTIYRKTKGNPLFVSRLMFSLSKDGLLRPSLNRGRWEWDDEKILCQQLPDDVAEFLTHSIGKLPEDVKSILCVLSCFGASVSSAFVAILEGALDRNLVSGLDAAVAEGFLVKTDDRYRFSHDRIQEAAYKMMNVLERCGFHFSFGCALAPLTNGDRDDGVLFIAANQFNLAGPEAAQVESQNAIVVNLNLRAGKKAMEMSDFEAAYSYFDNGISFLRKKHWKEHYALSLELFTLAAKCALIKGDVVSLTLLSQQVSRKAQSFEDKLNVMYLATCSLAFSSQLPESIEKGLAILSKLGIEVQGCGSSVEACIQETKALLSACTDYETLNSRRMTNPTMIMAMKFLGKMEVGMTQIMPNSAPYVMQRIIQLSLYHGMSPVSPVGFVHLGSYMAKLGDISGGYHYVKLARSLLDKVGSRESAGEVICFGTQVAAYVEPVQAALEHHNEGYAAAMASGDVNLAALNNMLYCNNSFFAGSKLQTMRGKCAEAIKFMKERKTVIFMLQTQFFQHTVFKLIGTDEEPEHLSEGNDILVTNNSVRASYYYQRAYTSFMLRSYDDTNENIKMYLACISSTWANLFFHHAFHSFYVGLISFWLARKSAEGQHWYQRGNNSKLALRRWAESSQWTFENKWYLLEAEDAYCNNNFDAAKAYYDKAISSAKDHKFINEETLAYELAAYFYLELPTGTENAMEYFLLAYEKYQEWGAFGKCDSLFQFVQSTFTRHLLALATRIILVATVHEIEKNEWNISKKSILGRREDTSKADSYFQSRLHL